MLLFALFALCVSNTYSETIYCTGHDACKNKIWNGEYDIFCGASNSERTCKSTTLNCGANKDCSIKTQGSGHDAYHDSIVYANNIKTGGKFELLCQSTGQRECKNNIIYCPREVGTECKCSGCHSSTIMYYKYGTKYMDLFTKVYSTLDRRIYNTKNLISEDDLDNNLPH